MRLLFLTGNFGVSHLIPSSLFSLSKFVRFIHTSLLTFPAGPRKSNDIDKGLSNPSCSHLQTHHTHMAPPASIIPCADADTWAVDRAVSLPELWALVAARSGLVGACRLAGVCRVARTRVREFLGTLPRLVVCGGGPAGGGVLRKEVWGLSLATLRWEAMSTLLCARSHHACCTVRGALVVLRRWNSFRRWKQSRY